MFKSAAYVASPMFSDGDNLRLLTRLLCALELDKVDAATLARVLALKKDVSESNARLLGSLDIVIKKAKHITNSSLSIDRIKELLSVVSTCVKICRW